jgi:lipopolysaccharide biosynthesis regulator YciM
METVLIVFLLAVIALILIYFFYDKYKKDKKSTYPTAYIDGLRALLDGREDTAFARLREVVSVDTNNVDAYIRIGDILRKYGKVDRALQVHKDLTIRHDLSENDKVMILRAMAQDYFELNENPAALAALKELLSLDSANRWALEKLLDLYARLEDWEAAFEIKERHLKIDGNRSKKGLAIYRFFQGEKLHKEREFHKARILFKEAVHFDPACTPAYLYMGDSYLAENRVEDAVAVWRRMLKAIPDESHLVVGRLQKALFDLGKFSEIANICNEILAAAPRNLDARITLADYHYKKGEYSLAAEHLNTAIEDHPDSYIAILDLAKIYLTIGEKKKLGGLIARLEEKREAIERQYHCSRCGHKTPTKAWLCPSCKAVDSFVM